MNLYVQGLNNNTIFPLKFSETIKYKYIEIISNIYYFNLRKTSKKFKREYIDNPAKLSSQGENDQAVHKIFNDIYRSFLKETRNEVIDFFKLQRHEVFDLPVKTMLRIYPFYLTKEDPIRKEYDVMTSVINEVIKKLERKEIIQEFVDDEHPEAMLSHVDKKIDFKRFLIDNGEENSDLKRIMEKFNQKYKSSN